MQQFCSISVLGRQPPLVFVEGEKNALKGMIRDNWIYCKNEER